MACKLSPNEEKRIQAGEARAFLATKVYTTCIGQYVCKTKKRDEVKK